ncbi:ABC transporter permease [Phytohabitans kaempferiae]|uniref:ABC transporter permease n=1 Tax=Phytohabitans kaempferiae TaxID=1620943 RepID=A0ABV6M9Z8_9ACTN
MTAALERGTRPPVTVTDGGGRRRANRRVWLLVLPLVGFVVLLFVLPFVAVARSGFGEMTAGQVSGFSVENYATFLGSSLYLKALLNTLIIGAATVVLAALAGLPYAYLLRTKPRLRTFAIFALFAPLLVNGVVRVYGVQLLVRAVNRGLAALGIPELPVLYSMYGIVIGMVLFMFPQMTIAIYASLDRMDDRLAEAARTLGAGRWQIIRHVVLPHARPGLVAGGVLTFAAAAGSYLGPAMLGGGKVVTMPTLIYSSFSATGDWSFGAAVATILTVVLLPIMAYSMVRSMRAERDG